MQRYATAGLLLLVVVSALGASSDGAGCPEDSVVGDDGKCDCLTPCPQHDCQPGQQPVQVRKASGKPGSCCSLYECRNQATLSYMPEDPTTSRAGGECEIGINRYQDGQSWQDPFDSCTTCTCRNGNISCTTPNCRSCPNPVPRQKGECCDYCPPPPLGSCPSLRMCKLSCENGLEKDEAGCEVCRCRVDDRVTENEVDLDRNDGDDSLTANATTTTTTTTSTSCPPQDCELSCEHGLLLDKDGCRVCQCRPIGCPANIVCERSCPGGYRTNKRGCPTCRCRGSCLDERNATRPEGTSWKSDACRSCACDIGGQISCNETVCSVGCSQPAPPPLGQCCPVCPASDTDELHGWGTAPIIIIVALALLCVALTIRLVRGRFRARLVPGAEAADFAGFSSAHHQQYYKCVPVYETHHHVPTLMHAEKIAPP